MMGGREARIGKREKQELTAALELLTFEQLKDVNRSVRQPPRRGSAETIAQIVERIGNLPTLMQSGNGLQLFEWNEIIEDLDGKPRNGWSATADELRVALVLRDVPNDVLEDVVADLRDDDRAVRSIAKATGSTQAYVRTALEDANGNLGGRRFVRELEAALTALSTKKPSAPPAPPAPPEPPISRPGPEAPSPPAHAPLDRARLVLRDHDTETILHEMLGGDAGDRAEGLGLQKLVALADAADVRCTGVLCFAMGASPAALSTAAGSWILAAAQNRRFRLVIDGNNPLSTGSLLRKLEREGGQWDLSVVERRGRRKFHMKVGLFRLERGEKCFLLSIVGSGNVSAGGFRDNDELFVLHAQVADANARGPNARAPELELAWTSLRTEIERVLELAKPATVPPPDEPSYGGLGLRPYQEEAVTALAKLYGTGEPRPRDWEGSILALPPGAGKTRIASELILRLAERGLVKRAVWIAPKPELARQAFHELLRLGVSSGFFQRNSHTLFSVAKKRCQSFPPDYSPRGGEQVSKGQDPRVPRRERSNASHGPLCGQGHVEVVPE